MTTRLLQPSFTAGEVSPALHGRVDIVRYSVGLKRCRNFIVRPYGGVENRAGHYFLGDGFDNTQQEWRLLPFVFSADAGSDVAYLLELGHLYCRFWADDALVQVQAADVSAWSNATTYAKHDYVKVGSVVYRSLQAANLNNNPASQPTWWVADATLVLATPWTAAQVPLVRYTQSADVLYTVNQSVPPMMVQRTSSSFFRLEAYVPKEGPFRDLNTDEAAVVVASAATGNVTITSNRPIFGPNSVGSLFYMETKNLGQIKPWVVGDRSVTVGALRRSDGKTYRASTVPSGGTSYKATGNRQPVHDFGKAWDGAGDVQTDGTNTWTVGIEWEYVDSGYGIVLITSLASSTVANATVQKRLPGQVVGTVPSATDTWTFNGNGVTKSFVLAAPAASVGNYTVEIGGNAVQSDPNYTPPPATGGGGTSRPNGGTSGRGDTAIP